MPDSDLDTDVLYEAGIFTGVPETEDAYRLWAEAMAASTPEKSKTFNKSSGLAFWIVLRVPKGNFSETIEFNEEMGCWFPKEGKGELWGIASTKKQLEVLLDTSFVDATSPMKKYIYISYMIRLRQREDWVDLLKFFSDRDLLEQDN